MRDILSFREIPEEAWGSKPPDFDKTDEMLEMFRAEDQSHLMAQGYRGGNCWYTMSYNLKTNFQGCHGQLQYGVNKNPFLFNALMRNKYNKPYLKEVDIYSKHMSSADNPAWKETMEQAYVCRHSASDDRIIGWVWPNLKTTPAFQTTHFCISTRDLTEHSQNFKNFLLFYEGKDYANGDPRLAWMLCQYFSEDTSVLNTYNNGHYAFDPNDDGKIPLPYISGPAPEAKKPSDSWSLYINKYYNVFDKKSNNTVPEFILRYKEILLKEKEGK